MNNDDLTPYWEYLRAFKRTLVYAISNQLFNESADSFGESRINQNVPNRVGEIEKMCLYLQWDRRNCKFYSTIRKLTESTDPQFQETARILQVCIKYFKVFLEIISFYNVNVNFIFQKNLIDAYAQRARIDGISKPKTFFNEAKDALRRQAIRLNLNHAPAVEVSQPLDRTADISEDIDPELTGDFQDQSIGFHFRQEGLEYETRRYEAQQKSTWEEWLKCE